MNVRKLCCQGCGADLEVDDSIRFVNCNYCGARLEIVRDASTTHSRLLDKIERRTGEMAGELKIIRLQNDLEQLDRELAITTVMPIVSASDWIAARKISATAPTVTQT